jgi:hypothetical protein
MPGLLVKKHVAGLKTFFAGTNHYHIDSVEYLSTFHQMSNGCKNPILYMYGGYHSGCSKQSNRNFLL